MIGGCTKFGFVFCFQEHLVKDNVALDFVLEVFITWKQERGVSNVVSGLKRSGLESK